ncbi:Diacylglycerol kinase [Baekduia alba]|uniref:diacylglycerol/lipid kinase family protein n=1 Tax=Baekduia alba TaxID=2997333 RepID=UPI00233FD9D3|nr:diacylglycerol kinase family protein [Baekduia alba]WCB94176.1 Diacylglycerol kinase [Baekduia alba]
MSRPIALLVNPSAGGGRALKVLPAVEAELQRLGLTHRVAMTESIRHTRELATAAADAGEVAVPLSGDGLVGAVAAALRGRDDAVMGVLPGGRGNDFARSVGIPRDAVAACAILADGVPTPLDVGEVVSDGGASHDPQTFIGIASLGFDSDANRIANEAPAVLGPLVYAYGALRALATFRPATFDVAVDRERRTFTGWSVGACNTSFYGGGMRAAPDARLDDGQLDVLMCWPRSRVEFLTKVLPRVFKGTHTELDVVACLRGAEVRVAADRPFTVYADGDPIGELPVTIRAVPGAIKVLLPAA